MDATQPHESHGTGSGATARLLGAFAALGAGAIAVVLGVLLVRDLPAVTSTASTSVATSNAPATPAPASPAHAGFPLPPRGSVVFGAEAGQKALGLAVTPKGAKIGLQASVVGIEGNGLRGLKVLFDVAGPSGKTTTVAGAPCGDGCYRAVAAVKRPLSVKVRLSGERPVSFAMPAIWPAPRADRIVRLADAAWRNLHTLAYHDSLGDGKVVLETEWKIVGPNRIEFKIASPYRGAGIIIGDRRWDQARGTTRWVASPQLAVHQPVPFWSSATNVHLLGTVMSHGRPAWKISFFDAPGGPGWFTILVDKATYRTTELWMTAQDHFMHETYRGFNAPIKIVPPK